MLCTRRALSALSRYVLVSGASSRNVHATVVERTTYAVQRTLFIDLCLWVTVVCVMHLRRVHGFNTEFLRDGFLFFLLVFEVRNSYCLRRISKSLI